MNELFMEAEEEIMAEEYPDDPDLMVGDLPQEEQARIFDLAYDRVGDKLSEMADQAHDRMKEEAMGL